MPLAKDAVVAIGLSNFTTDLDAEDIENDETDFSSRRSDAVAYFSDDGSVSSPASKGSKEFLPTFGQGNHPNKFSCHYLRFILHRDDKCLCNQNIHHM